MGGADGQADRGRASRTATGEGAGGAGGRLSRDHNGGFEHMSVTERFVAGTAAVLVDRTVDVRAVYRTFEQDTAPVRALRGADLVVEGGEFVAVMGPSGCGKSTLLNLIAGLDVPDEGEIVIAGESLVGMDE